jgi:hypothetical protein
MTIVHIETYVVAKRQGSGKEGGMSHEKWMQEVYVPALRRLDKRLRSIRYFSSIAAQDISSMGGRMIISEYDSLADMEKAGKEFAQSEEGKKLTFQFADMIEHTTHRASIWQEGSHAIYVKPKRQG